MEVPPLVARIGSTVKSLRLLILEDRGRHERYADDVTVSPRLSVDPTYIFVSYSRADRAYVKELVAFLRHHKVEVWVDDQVPTGDRWDRTLRARIDECAALLLIMSPAAYESHWVAEEIERARVKKKPVLPLLLSGEVFFGIARVQYEDVTDGGMPSVDFLSRIRTLLEPVQRVVVDLEDDRGNVVHSATLQSANSVYASGNPHPRPVRDQPTTSQHEQAPPGVDANTPSVARVYDYFLGGKDNFAVDRLTAEIALKVTPDGRHAAQANRIFLRQVVRYLILEVGIRQFLDVGSGLPSRGCVHEIAQSVGTEVRVVYVDNDPSVLAHGKSLLATVPGSAMVLADLREPKGILLNPDTQRLINRTEPVGLLLLSILHHLGDDEDPGGVTAQLRDTLPLGSAIAISHFHNPGYLHPGASQKALMVETIFNAAFGTGRWRSRSEILGYFGDLHLVDPGLVPLPEWRPEHGGRSMQTDTFHTFVGGVARTDHRTSCPGWHVRRRNLY